MDLVELRPLLNENRDELRRRKVQSLAIFGSVARAEDSLASDIDILVEFAEPVTLFEFFRLKRYLEELTGRTVDLVTPEALRPQLRKHILEEAVPI